MIGRATAEGWGTARETREPGKNGAPARRPRSGKPSHPPFGALRGTVRFAPDLDLTASGDPEWGARACQDDD